MLTETDEQVTVENKHRDSITYRGVAIEGLDSLEAAGVTSREKVLALLDQLPAEYFALAQVDTIIFKSEAYFTVKRNDKIVVIPEHERQTTDVVVRRVRGITTFNSELIDGQRVATNGKQTITIYSSKNWGTENDEDVALYTLAHELGHCTWNATVYAPTIARGLLKLGKIEHLETRCEQLRPIIEEWKKLPKSNLPRFVSYQDEFMQEKNREAGTLEETELDLTLQEDFAVAHEYYLYWHTLMELDPDRDDLLAVAYQEMSELSLTKNE
ncbi:hypothetical protein KA078_01665 [Candidatus Woesebacteria bacterium]|nr:hypothetical protein [Candidatus Woesebacteria bacterium]